MNRRTFLHTTLAATAGTAFLPRKIFAADAATAAGQALLVIVEVFLRRSNS